MGNQEICQICERTDIIVVDPKKANTTPKREKIGQLSKNTNSQLHKDYIADSIQEQSSLPVPDFLKSFTGRQRV